MFGTIRSQSTPCSIRLVKNTFPDFELRFDERIEQFELTEADAIEGRQRGKEYRKAAAERAAGLRPPAEPFDASERQRAALRTIPIAIERKAAKHYRPAPHLLIYINCAPLFGRLPLTEEPAIQIVTPWGERFVSIWLLWGSYAVRLCPNPAKIGARDLPVPT